MITASIVEAGFGDAVSVRCEGGFAWLASDTYPAHDLMNGIVGTNEQIPVPAPGYESPIPLEPVMADSPTTIDAALGVAVNGVPIYDYSAQGELDLENYDARVDTVVLQQLDRCGGHAGRGDDYHYHARPDCMIEMMANADAQPIIGWGFDGYPIYGDDNPDGSPIAEGELGLCNGKADDTFGWRYHTSDAPPYIVQCLRGQVDTGMLPRVAPLEAQGGGGARPSGRPPQGGVENLVHIRMDDGTRRMTYDYEGEAYYLQYAPADAEDCWAFETRTVTAAGALDEGVYCRVEARPSPPR